MVRGITLFYIAVDDGISKHAFAKDSDYNDKVVYIEHTFWGCNEK